MFAQENASAQRVAEQLLRAIFEFRRIQPDGCEGENCQLCIAPYIHKVTQRVASELPVQLMILAYPFKAPNPAKVLGEDPDMAELISLKYLNQLCVGLRKIYQPGVEMIIAGDGRVFADVIDGVGDEKATRYTLGIKEMVRAHRLEALTFQGLDDLFVGLRPDELRAMLPEVESRETLAERAKREEELMYQLNGITHFALADIQHTRTDLSSTARKKRAREAAYALIARGDALRRLFAERYPDAVRCSIHPQKTHSDKIGIRMIAANEQWASPWHSCAVQLADGSFQFMKRSDAEAAGAMLVASDGVPSYFVLAQS